MMYAKRRDICEKAIVQALKAAGASVTQLDAKGAPDLLVGFNGGTFLLECKDPDVGARNSRAKGKRVSNDMGLRDSQWAWWSGWTGAVPVIVTNENEALVAIGAKV